MKNKCIKISSVYQKRTVNFNSLTTVHSFVTCYNFRRFFKFGIKQNRSAHFPKDIKDAIEEYRYEKNHIFILNAMIISSKSINKLL